MESRILEAHCAGGAKTTSSGSTRSLSPFSSAACATSRRPGRTREEAELVSVADVCEQALINLIKNASEALLDRSGRVRLATSCDRPTGDVVISVADDGPGIDPVVELRVPA